MQKGFIQIPILIAILVVAALSGGAYVAYEVSKPSPAILETEITADVRATTTQEIKKEDTEPARDIQTDINITSSESENKPIEVTPPTVNTPQKYSLDIETSEMCGEVRTQDIPNTQSLIGNLLVLCDRAQNDSYESKNEFDALVKSIHEKWDLWLKVESVGKKDEGDIDDTKPETQYSDTACLAQKQSYVSEADAAYLSWYDQWQSARATLDSCYNSNPVPYCDNKMTDINVEWQAKISTTMKSYQDKLTQCSPDKRIFNDVSDMVSSPY